MCTWSPVTGQRSKVTITNEYDIKLTSQTQHGHLLDLGVMEGREVGSAAVSLGEGFRCCAQPEPAPALVFVAGSMETEIE